jgi:hypothetical protein
VRHRGREGDHESGDEERGTHAATLTRGSLR